MTKIYAPRISRSGASMTIRGRDVDGKPLKVTNVLLVEFWASELVAVTHDQQFQLVA